MEKISKNEGFVKLIFVIVAAILILSYFRVDLRSIIQSETFQKNISYVLDGVKYVWGHFIARPLVYVWNLLEKSGSSVMSEIDKIAPK